MVQWVFVEGADRVYAQCNPSNVRDGLSTDGTTEWLEELARSDDRIVHTKLGLFGTSDPAQSKCVARQKYLDAAESVRPDAVWVVDADEFYSRDTQLRTMLMLERDLHGPCTGFMLKQRHLWRPACIASRKLGELEAVGGYWSVPHCRGWRWLPGMRYCRNHNWPEVGSKLLNSAVLRYNRIYGSPECIHTGYASRTVVRAAKHRYYEARGESSSRRMYVDCRRAYETWQLGQRLPHGASVVPFVGELPEALR
jgi:hypothetical protein